jgi:ubiquinone/menaquinone biosynthesis C-methylase UbiE
MPRIPVPDLFVRALSRQLGNPTGPMGSLVARMLNKNNAAVITAAVEALGLTGGERVADIGFGGGLGLDLLLDAVGDDGRVYGVEPSPSMLDRARKAHEVELEAGRLELDEATMASLPFPDAALDGWISLNTVYFVHDLAPAFAELARVLRDTGRGVLGIGDPEWMGRQRFTRHNFTLRPVPEVVGALTTAGLEVEPTTVSRGGGPSFHLLVCRVPGSAS